MAGGPKYSYPSVRGLDDEMANIYHDIGNQKTANVGSLYVNGNQVYVLLYSSTVYDVSGTSATQTSSFVPTKTTITLTPHSITSRIEVSFSGVLRAGVTGTNAEATLLRGGAIIVPGSSPDLCATGQTAGTGTATSGCSATIIDTPSTVSAVTYTVGIASSNGTNAIQWNPLGDTSQITVKEWSY